MGAAARSLIHRLPITCSKPILRSNQSGVGNACLIKSQGSCPACYADHNHPCHSQMLCRASKASRNLSARTSLTEHPPAQPGLHLSAQQTPLHTAADPDLLLLLQADLRLSSESVHQLQQHAPVQALLTVQSVCSNQQSLALKLSSSSNAGMNATTCIRMLSLEHTSQQVTPTH